MGMVLWIKNTNIRLLPGNFKIHHFQLIEKQNFLPKGNPDNSKLIFVPKYWINRVFPEKKEVQKKKIFWTSEIFNLGLMTVLKFFSLALLRSHLCLLQLPLVTLTWLVLCGLASWYSMPFHLAHAAFPYGTRKTSFGVTCKEYNLQRLI